MKTLALLTTIFISSVTLAHVTMETNNKTAGGYAKLTFRVPHGCDGSATTAITVQIPENSLSVKPQIHTGWKIATKKVKLAKPVTSHGKEITETLAEVTWSGGVLSDEYMDEFGLSIKLPETKEAKLVFPVIQKCKKGEAKWEPEIEVVQPAASEHSHH